VPAQAAITIVVGAPGVKTNENVLFQNAGPANSIVTTTNKGTQVTFTGQETLDATAGGQAKITGADGRFNALNFFATDPSLAFGAVEFSLSGLNGPGAPDDVFATIRFIDQFGTATTLENAALGNGQIWFAAFATMGSAISRMEITTSADIRDARHFRITTANLAAPVPEPAAWLMLIVGFGAVGGALRHRNRRTLAHAYSK
jgi:hypothetical protein